MSHHVEGRLYKGDLLLDGTSICKRKYGSDTLTGMRKRASASLNLWPLEVPNNNNSENDLNF